MSNKNNLQLEGAHRRTSIRSHKKERQLSIQLSWLLIFTFVEDKGNAPEVAWSPNIDLIAVASMASPKHKSTQD